MKALRTIAAALVCSAAVSAAAAPPEMPESMRFLPTFHLFESIRTAPGFNVDKPATYGFFFNSADRKLLKKLRTILEDNGYSFVGQQKDGGVSTLKMSKVEVHTVNSLVERNRTLFALAKSLGAASYDGWDIAHNEP